MSGDAIRLGPHVTQLRGENRGKYPGGNPVRVAGGDTVVQLDATFHADPASCDLLVLSHYHEDHVVAAGERAPAAAIHARDEHAVRSWEGFRSALGMPDGDWGAEMRREFRWSPIEDVRPFDDATTFDVGGSVSITAIPLPGHTAGHCGFLIEPDGVFYLADVDLTSFGPMYGDTTSSLTDTRASIAACAQVAADTCATYHQKGPYTEHSEFLAALDAYARVLDEREERLLALLDAGRTRAGDMPGGGVVFRPGRRPAYADAVERVMCADHLDDLTRRGVLQGPDDEGRYRRM